VFVREGDRATAMTATLFLVVEGSVAVTTARPEGGFGVDRRLGPGEVFGHVALMADVARTASCEAATQVTIARLDRRTFEELNRRNAGVHARFQLVVARQLASDLRALHDALGRAMATGDDAHLRPKSA
jgi:CRP-like cAMP-binding protein